MTCPACGSEVPPAFRFCGNCGQKLAEAAGSPASARPAAAAPGGERRWVTVVFADVSGFTKMCEQLDPEDVHTLMNECFAGLGGAIREEEGYIDKYIGDNVMALFGAPVAHEDDPARACRAALAMQAFLSGFAERWATRTGTPLRMRIGINCGLVLAGDIGSDHRMDYSVTGDTVNLAARLEAAAPPGGVLVSAEVARRTRHQFEFGPGRQLQVKGKEQPVEVYELLREEREEPGGRDRLAVPFVGRDAEQHALLERWRGAGAGAAWIEIRGDIGIGKTRLVEAAGERMKDRTLLAVSATPSASRRPFGLVRRLVLAAVSELGDHAPHPETREEFAAALAALGDEPAPFLDALWYLVVPSGVVVPVPDPDPQTVRRMLERGVGTLLRCLAARVPGLTLFLDSYELSDEPSAELLESLAHGDAGLSLPVIVAARDGATPPRWPDAVIRLGPLPAEAAGELLDRLTHGVPLPEKLRTDILDRAAGVPLFLAEMVQGLVDQGVLAPAADGAWCWGCGAEPVAVTLPASIRAAMVARLDRLARPARDLLNQCSVQGVEFELDVAEAVRRAPDRQGPPAEVLLPELERAGLVAGGGPDAPTRWVFCQPLMQEACYETLLLRERRALHAETAQALCDLLGSAELVSPALLAHHYGRAERWTDAAAANLRAGLQAADMFLNDEATRRYQRVLDSIGRLPAPSDADAELAGRAHRGAALVHLRLGAYVEGEQHATAARGGARRPGHRAEADRLLAAARLHTGRTEEAARLLVGAVAGAGEDREAGDVAVHALHDLAALYHRANRNAEALERLREARALAGPEHRLTLVHADILEGNIAHTEGRFAEAAGLYARAYEQAEAVGSLSDRARASNNMGNAARDLGDYEGARRHFQRALEIWERTGDAECIAGAHNNLGNLAMSQGDLDTARSHHERSLAGCRAIGNVHGAALAQANLAVLAVEQDDGAAAVAHARQALDTLADSGNVVLRGLVQVVLGEAYLASSRPADAEEVFEQVLRDYDESRHPLALAGAWRGLGRVALLRGRPADAVTVLARGLEGFERLKREQEAARTALYRAEALWRCGERERARAELAQVQARFVSMRAGRDADRAGRLLRELTREAGVTGS